MMLPDGNDVETQGVLAEYTYTARYCPELGQQPRFYNVRAPIHGSDWRNDGGRAIVLIRTANIAPALYTFGNLGMSGDDPSPAGAVNRGKAYLTGSATRVYGLTTGDLISDADGN